MDITSLYYFAEVAKDLNITRTANRLYISQQTLSNHIQRLEEYFGAALLYRKPHLALTYAGEFVLSYANVVAKEETNLKDILSDIEHKERGVINLGGSTLRLNMLPAILPRFSERYPNVELRLENTLSNNLEPLVSKGELDFAIVTQAKADNNLIQEHLISDEIYLCVADSLLYKHYGMEANEIKARSIRGAHLRDFAKLPFCIYNNYMGNQIQNAFDDEKVTPIAYLTTKHTQLSTNVGFTGIAAFFATRVNLAERRGETPAGMNIFPLMYREEQMKLDVFLLRHKQRYMTHYAKYFVELLLDYYEQVEKERISRLAVEE